MIAASRVQPGRWFFKVAALSNEPGAARTGQLSPIAGDQPEKGVAVKDFSMSVQVSTSQKIICCVIVLILVLSGNWPL